MPPFRGWTDLPPELVGQIADGLDDLKCYASTRGACSTWRRALPPPAPSLLVDHGAAAIKCRGLCPAARRSFQLAKIPAPRTCLGCCSGWLALSVFIDDVHSLLSLFHPVTAAEILLPPLIYNTRLVSKIVFAPNPATDDFAATAICDIDRLAYVTAGARRWAVLDPVHLAAGDQLVDLLYHGNGMVYCLTRFGDVHVLRLPQRRRREPIILECHTPADYPVVHNKRIFQMHGTGPDLNVRATDEPLLSSVGNPVFDAATCFTQPYIPVSIFTSAKNLVFCEGNLYQIWRNVTCTVTLQLSGEGRRRVVEDEIFVMRYDPWRRPCWDAVSDLGGYSIFVGRNNVVSMHAEGVPGLMGDCVYWIGGRGRDQGMVFNMKTGRSTPCLPPLDGVVLGSPQSTICWYFLSDTVNNGNNTYERGVYRTRARARAESGQK
ncbi:hypothetical protein CFC21_045059 [Triticum aestivum]|uniref:KIB1-4 beta-propeller domain-containing protein n=3 Tax=Triticum TaxID=4564 RepID=A0A9R1JY70_WHEAT|nr:hypothetical protein CFC21_045059 [Triticum aestivum]CDM86987.1 unnamed protein product [Triticum aestivum]VAH86610.1 unnamed protein product [Triticum turgidum subsp. durum]